MKSSWYSVAVIVFLFVLLGVLAWFQYVWLGQISQAESERLKVRLESDVKRFSTDFNREISKIYFTFQTLTPFQSETPAGLFSKRYDKWLSETKFPKLVGEVYLVKKEENDFVLEKYNLETKNFEAEQWTPQLLQITEKFKPKPVENESVKVKLDLVESVDARLLALMIPVNPAFKPLTEEIKKVSPTTDVIETKAVSLTLKAGIPTNFLVVKLNEESLKNELIPHLLTEYFPESDGFRIEITDNDSTNTIFSDKNFQTEEEFEASSKFFTVNPELGDVKFAGEINSSEVRIDSQTIRIDRSPNKIKPQERQVKIISPEKTPAEFNLMIDRNNIKTASVLRTTLKRDEGIWTLKVQHPDGSLENFVAKTRQRNLLISFGILGLLGVSIGLIFISSQRAKMLAQRQLDFVSSVSHEFRTPLAVIYSAGENLTDGVINSPSQVSNYGNLIKREGKKLSSMVEQILEFAGADSGRRKYFFKETDVRELVENALSECESLIKQKGISLEKQGFEKELKLMADSGAMSLALQNLIVNGIKYNNGDNRLKISLSDLEKEFEIVVEDYGLGISAKEQRQIFEPFYRVKEVVDAQINGNGLGLSLVKKIVSAHQGKVSVESKIGKGSKFIIRLPK